MKTSFHFFVLLLAVLLYPDVHADSIHEAAAAGDVQKLGQLLGENRALVNAQDEWGWTPLMSAVREKRIDTVAFLLARGARVSIKERTSGENAIGIARSYINECNDEYLQRHVAFWKLQKRSDEQIAAQVAAYRQDHGPDDRQKWRQIEALLSDALTKELATDRQSPIFKAVADGSIEEVNQLLEAGARVGVKDAQGRTPLMLAVMYQQVEIAQVLLAHGANMFERDDQGNTPYSLAHRMSELFADVKRKREQQVTRKWIEEGRLEIDRKDQNGETALMRAVAEGRLEDVEFLLSMGARTDVKNDAGQSLFNVVCTRVPGKDLKEKILKCIDTHEEKAPAQGNR